MKINIWVTGDPINDVYYTGKYREPSIQTSVKTQRFDIEEIMTVEGGVLNVLYNLDCLVSDAEEIICWPTWSNTLQEDRKLIRLVADESMIEFWDEATQPEHMYYHSDPFALLRELNEGTKAADKQVLIISDYNKGMVNKKTKPLDFHFDLAVVDSRYRTLNLSLLENCKTKIWHATGTEYNWEWAQNFDWVIWTNGPGLVWIGPTKSSSTSREDWLCVPVPDTTVVDVTGAGDTFTAAVAGYLARNYNEITADALLQASKFAIRCCQEVIQQKYCAVTTQKV